MPTIPIPSSAYEANALLGTRRSLALDSRTRLVRAHDEFISMRYRRRGDTVSLVQWNSDGSLRISPERYGWSRGSLRRIDDALPRGWAVEYPRRMPDGRIRRPRILYRGSYDLSLQTFTITQDGSVRFGDRSVITIAELDHDASEAEGFSVPAPRRPRPAPSYLVHADVRRPPYPSPLAMERARQAIAAVSFSWTAEPVLPATLPLEA